MTRLLSTIISLIVLLFLTAGSVFAGSLNVRIEQPKSPTNQNTFNIGFVAQDTEIPQRVITVKCSKMGPGDVGYLQFGSDITLVAGGDSGNCSVDPSIITGQGTYNFKVTAQAGADPAVESGVVSVEYKTDRPGTPVNYSKSKSLCTYTINFRSADDGGKTAKVELYRSSNTSFSVDSGSRIDSKTLGSNTDGSFTDSPSDCNTQYYYAIRAFDTSGNGSGVVGDSVTITTTITQSPSPAAEAIVVTTTTGGSAGGGSILGEQASPSPAAEGGATTSGGEVKGAAEAASPLTPLGNILSNKALIIAGILLLLVLAFYLYRRRQA